MGEREDGGDVRARLRAAAARLAEEQTEPRRDHEDRPAPPLVTGPDVAPSTPPPPVDVPPPAAYPPPPAPAHRGARYPPPPPPPVHRGPDGFAIASLVFGILALPLFPLGLVALAALALGIMALAAIRREGRRGRGMAVAGIVLGGFSLALFVLFIVAVSFGSPHDGASRDGVVAGSGNGPSLDHVFVGVPGFTLDNVPRWTLASVTDKVERDTAIRAFVADAAARSVWRDGRRVAVAVAISIDDRYRQLPHFERNYVTDVPRASPHRTITVDGQDVIYYPDAHGVQKLSAYRNGILLTVLAETKADRADLEQVLAALLPNLAQ